jgi:hypothetical protein
MKKVILFLMLVIGLSAQAQNLVGRSFRDVKGEMDRRGYYIKEGFDKDNDYYLSASSSTEYKVYYFTKSNLCAVYVYTIKDIGFKDFENSLYSNGYVRNTDGRYYTENYVAIIDYNAEYSYWYVKIGMR